MKPPQQFLKNRLDNIDLVINDDLPYIISMMFILKNICERFLKASAAPQYECRRKNFQKGLYSCFLSTVVKFLMKLGKDLQSLF